MKVTSAIKQEVRNLILAQKTLENCSHLIISERDVLIGTCDGVERICLICNHIELEDCYGMYNEFTKLKKSPIVLKNYFHKIENLEDFLNNLPED